MKSGAWLYLAIAALSVILSIGATSQRAHALRPSVCEDECLECGEVHRCGATEIRYLCQMGGLNSAGRICVKPVPVACMCCEDNEILVGTHATGRCVRCPHNQLPNDVDDTNTCGCFDSARQFSECERDQKCFRGECCTPTSRETACAGRCDTTASDGCGGTYTCPPCPPTVTLSVSKIGSGRGTIISSPAGIHCGSVCSKTYAGGTRVTLTAGPLPGSEFTQWFGDPDCEDEPTGTAQAIVTLNLDKSCQALFERVQ